MFNNKYFIATYFTTKKIKYIVLMKLLYSTYQDEKIKYIELPDFYIIVRSGIKLKNLVIKDYANTGIRYVFHNIKPIKKWVI